jgi:hypothetical protein
MLLLPVLRVWVWTSVHCAIIRVQVSAHHIFLLVGGFSALLLLLLCTLFLAPFLAEPHQQLCEQ